MASDLCWQLSVAALRNEFNMNDEWDAISHGHRTVDSIVLMRTTIAFPFLFILWRWKCGSVSIYYFATFSKTHMRNRSIRCDMIMHTTNLCKWMQCHLLGAERCWQFISFSTRWRSEFMDLIREKDFFIVFESSFIFGLEEFRFIFWRWGEYVDPDLGTPIRKCVAIFIEK